MAGGCEHVTNHTSMPISDGSRTEVDAGHAQEIARLHRDAWIKGGGEVRIGGKAYKGEGLKTVDVDELQAAMWSDRRPIVVGRQAIEAEIWGNLGPYIANLNSPHELFKLGDELGYARYLLCLSIVLGRPICNVSLPSQARVAVPEYSASPFALLEEKRARRRQVRPRAVSAPNAAGGAGRLVVSLTLKELQGLFPLDGSDFPNAAVALNCLNAAGIAEDLRRQPFGLWRKLPEATGEKDLYEGMAVIYMPGVVPERVFATMRARDKWIEFYPGLLGMEKVSTVERRGVYRLEFGTPLGRIQIISAHSDGEDDLQVRWDDPPPAHIAAMGLAQGSGTIIKHVRGSMTFLDAVDGTYLCYSLAMDAPKFNAQGTREVGLMNRIIPIALSAHARTMNPAWGLPPAASEAFKARLALYGTNFDPMSRASVLKGQLPANAIPYSKVWTVENSG